MVEMLVALIATTMLMTAVTRGMMVMSNSYQVSSAKVDLQYQAQTTLNMMVEELKYAKGIVASYKDEGGIYVTKQGEVSKQPLDLFCVAQQGGGYTYFYLKDQKLYMKEASTKNLTPDATDATQKLVVDNTHLLATHIKTLSIEPHHGTMNETGVVTLEIGFERKEEALTLSSTATIRNKE